MTVEIFDSGFLPAQSRLGFGHMEVLIDESAAEASGQITYLYKYVCKTRLTVSDAEVTSKAEVATALAHGEQQPRHGAVIV